MWLPIIEVLKKSEDKQKLRDILKLIGQIEDVHDSMSNDMKEFLEQEFVGGTKAKLNDYSSNVEEIVGELN